MSFTTTPAGHAAKPFRGFEPLTGNFIYCPNQFFDVCLPHCSRGAVRLVGYMLFRTLGWLDGNGCPVEENISVTYRDLIIHAGISRGGIADAIDEAMEGGFISRTHIGRAKSKGKTAQTARYTLRWNTASAYTRDYEVFSGFYAGEGNRSPIPNAFFELLLPQEGLAVTKVVGTVLRHTIGYQNRFGGRRSEAPLSYTFIQQFANLKSKSKLAAALRRSLAAGYIRCIDPGQFGPDTTKRKAATYALIWLEKAVPRPIGSKKEPATSDRFKKGTRIGSIREPADRFKKGTKVKTAEKYTLKQQQPAVVLNSQSYELLRTAGIGTRAAEKLAAQVSHDRIRQQIEWLPFRNAGENPAGMLRRAIEEQWPEPVSVQRNVRQERSVDRQDKLNAERVAAENAMRDHQRDRLQVRQALQARWQNLTAAQKQHCHQTAIEQASSETQRRILLRWTNLETPPVAILEAMTLAPAILIGESSR